MFSTSSHTANPRAKQATGDRFVPSALAPLSRRAPALANAFLTGSIAPINKRATSVKDARDLALMQAIFGANLSAQSLLGIRRPPTVIKQAHRTTPLAKLSPQPTKTLRFPSSADYFKHSLAIHAPSAGTPYALVHNGRSESARRSLWSDESHFKFNTGHMINSQQALDKSRCLSVGFKQPQVGMKVPALSVFDYSAAQTTFRYQPSYQTDDSSGIFTDCALLSTGEAAAVAWEEVGDEVNVHTHFIDCRTKRATAIHLDESRPSIRPTGITAQVTGHGYCTTNARGIVTFWDRRKLGLPVMSFFTSENKAAVKRASFSQNHPYQIAVGTGKSDGYVRVFDLSGNTAHCLSEAHLDSQVTAVCWSPSNPNQLYASTGYNGYNVKLLTRNAEGKLSVEATTTRQSSRLLDICVRVQPNGREQIITPMAGNGLLFFAAQKPRASSKNKAQGLELTMDTPQTIR